MREGINDFYLGTLMNRYEYMIIRLKNIHDCIMKGPKWERNGGMCKEMYGIPQARILADNQLVKYLAKYNYHLVKITLGIF